VDVHSGATGVAGRALVTSGARGGALLDIGGERPGLGFGIGVGGRHDFDGDGVPDVLVAAAYHAMRGEKSGRVYVLSGVSILHVPDKTK
jgi:hypothetical protein